MTSYNLVCPSGQYVTQFYGRSGDGLNQIGIKCSDGSDPGFAGGNGGDAFTSVNTRSGYKSVGIYTSNSAYGSGGFIANGIDASTTAAGLNKGNCAGIFDMQTCPSGQILSGISGTFATVNGYTLIQTLAIVTSPSLFLSYTPSANPANKPPETPTSIPSTTPVYVPSVTPSYKPSITQTYSFVYRGSIEQFVVPKNGTLLITAAGAASGPYLNQGGGYGEGPKGGIITCTFQVIAGQVLYISVGQAGISWGYGQSNGQTFGGGEGGSSGGGQGGGGSDVRTVQSDLNSRLIVAGGGGGNGYGTGNDHNYACFV